MCHDERPQGQGPEGYTTENGVFSIRGFLAERGAFVVHFSTPMRHDDSLRFPDDLIRAQTMSEKGLCCSTILATDVGPGEPSIDPADANAVGCIGIILDFGDRDSVCAVHPSDCGNVSRC
jgi:hypothetical protein